jgi:hypothetical protein
MRSKETFFVSGTKKKKYNKAMMAMIKKIAKLIVPPKFNNINGKK